jgi:hypothetical protein
MERAVLATDCRLEVGKAGRGGFLVGFGDEGDAWLGTPSKKHQRVKWREERRDHADIANRQKKAIKHNLPRKGALHQSSLYLQTR